MVGEVADGSSRSGDLDPQQARPRGVDREARAVAKRDEQALAGQRELFDVAEFDIKRRLPGDDQPLGGEDALTRDLVRAVTAEMAPDHRRGSYVDGRLTWSQAVCYRSIDIDAGQSLDPEAGARLDRLALVQVDAGQDLVGIADSGAPDKFRRPAQIHGRRL